jgi:hypothetical protein
MAQLHAPVIRLAWVAVFIFGLRYAVHLDLLFKRFFTFLF